MASHGKCSDSTVAVKTGRGSQAAAATPAQHDPLEVNLIGVSPAFTDVIYLLRRVARSDATVLIEGETGTGKELAARAIHYLGARRDFPFIPVNCGALPDQLIENELFGHARGAYTDARDPAVGLIADAEGGTLFLDEVEALSQKAQVAMLRFLQDGSYRALGGRQLLHARVRVIAASNVDLADLVRTGAFRADFMYRLRLMAIAMPPLRARASDIPLLADHCLRNLAAQYGETKYLDAGSLAALERHPWPGNVRELESVLHREFLLSDDEQLRIREHSFDPAHALSRRLRPLAGEAGADAPPDFASAKARAIGEFERAYLIRALQRHGGNVTAAARGCGKERRAFGKMLKKYGIDKELYRAAPAP